MSLVQYNPRVDNKQIILIPNTRLVSVGAYLMTILMGFVGLLTLPDTRSRLLALPLLAVFGLLLSGPARAPAASRTVHLYLGAQVAAVFGLELLGPDSAAFQLLLLLPAAQAAITFPPRVTLRWVAVCFLFVSLDSWLRWGRTGLINILLNSAGYILLVGFGYTVRQAELARRRSQALFNELQAAQRQLQELAVLEERSRLAREMHDSLGHRLTVAVVQLEGAQRLIGADPNRAARMVSTMRDELKEALADLRRTVAALREDVPPLGEALTHLAETFQSSTGLPVHLQLPPNLPPLPPAQRLALYRAAQESLTNAHRHAAAGQVWLELSVGDGAIALVASDDGHGLDGEAANAAAGFGLRGLQERAAQLGGELALQTRPGGGAQLRFSLPLPEAG